MSRVMLLRFSLTVFLTFAVVMLFAVGVAQAAIVIDHEDTDLTVLTLAQIDLAKANLHIAYGHTSHGSQVTDGMTAMNTFINVGGLGLSYPTDTFKWVDSSSPPAGVLDLDDYFMDGDLGNPDYITWAARTRTYLGSAHDGVHDDVNVVMWSWCGQADTSAANINLYLNTMNQLETDYSDVTFVYMTGHVNGCSTTENLFLRNQQIRDYCTANDKVLYDFADIESWDPDDKYYGDKLVTDDCWYDSDDNSSRDKNWATDWQSSHAEGTDWFSFSCAHSQPLNGNQKAYAAWALWTQIAEARLPVPGDANDDGRVDHEDTARMAENWLASGVGWSEGDFNDDSLVDDKDATLLAINWHSGVPAAQASVPEPSPVVLLLCVSALGLFRRYR